MTKYITDKAVITQRILAIVQPNYTQGDLDLVMKQWWSNIRPTGGLGLTYAGWQAFTDAGIEQYRVQGKKLGLVGHGVIPTGRIRLQLDRCLPCPYYMGHYLGLTVYDSRVAMMIELHGSVLDYLNTLEDRTKTTTGETT